jgi:acylphosphatase
MSGCGLHVLVTGRVQGVAFRYYAQDRAVELGLTGWVRNLSDGRVELRMEGSADALESMKDWLHRGPPAARVRSVVVSELPAEGFEGFQILSTAFAP